MGDGTEQSQESQATEMIRVLTYVGLEDDVRKLEAVIRQEAEREIEAALGEIKRAGNNDALHFDDPVRTLEGLSTALSARKAPVLHIVSHAGRDGHMTVQDVWGALSLNADTLAAMVKGSGVRVAIISTCFGAEIARMLYERGAVEIAIGFTKRFPFSAAMAVAVPFFRSLALGRGPRRAAREGERSAAARIEKVGNGGQVVIAHDEENYLDDALVGQPDFHVIGPPSGDQAPVEALVSNLKGHRVYHVMQTLEGDIAEEGIEESLRNARIIMLLFEGNRIGNDALLEEVSEAIASARERGARLFPLFLKGQNIRESKAKVPYGMRRLHPAFLHDPKIGGDWQKMARRLEQLLEKTPRIADR